MRAWRRRRVAPGVPVRAAARPRDLTTRGNRRFAQVFDVGHMGTWACRRRARRRLSSSPGSPTTTTARFRFTVFINTLTNDRTARAGDALPQRNFPLCVSGSMKRRGCGFVCTHGERPRAAWPAHRAHTDASFSKRTAPRGAGKAAKPRGTAGKRAQRALS